MSATSSESVSQTPVRLQDDFDNACNAEWKATHPIPDKYPRYTNFTDLTERMEAVMKEICLSNKSELVSTLYNKFLNQTEEQVVQHIRKTIASIQQCETVDSLIEYLCGQIVEGNYYLFHICHSGTCRNPKFQIPHFNFSGLSMPDKSYYFERAELREDFETMIKTIFEALDLDTSHVGTIWDLETFIAEKHYNRADKREPLKTYHPCTMTSLLNTLGPQYSCLKTLLPKEYHDITLNNDELPVRFVEVFNKYSLEQLQTWMYWRVARGYVGSSVGTLYDTYFAFYRTKLSGVKTPRPLEERAVLFAKGMLEDEFSRIYMEDYADPALVTEFPVFVETLRKTLRDKISSFTWMSDATKAKAVDKLDSMTLKIIGPSKYEDYSHFNKEYATIFEFVDAYSKWDWDVLEVERKMYQLHDPETWEMSAVDVNAYYHPYYNEIVFPAGILQDPFYNPKSSYGDNAGGIGAVICHEMTHGFDDSGSKYDKDGYLHDWWTAEDRTKYERVISNMETYFNGLSYKDTPLNGRLTQGENLADLGGIKCAVTSCPDKEQQHNCLTAWARTWRANIRDEYAKQMTVVDPHSLPRFRINGILPHVPQFYEIFEVKEGDGMYLEESKRCNLYD